MCIQTFLSSSNTNSIIHKQICHLHNAMFDRSEMTNYPFFKLIVNKFHNNVVLQSQKLRDSVGNPWLYGIYINLCHVNLKYNIHVNNSETINGFIVSTLTLVISTLNTIYT